VPEGDTIHRSARALERALAGRRTRRFDLRGPAAPRSLRPRANALITGVEARGKHLLVHFDDGIVLRTHMGMHGAWHLYRDGERWRRPGTQARVIIETDDGTVAVCFAAPSVETARATEMLRQVGDLGPDLCTADPDIDEVVRRAGRLDPHTEVGVALLDQRVAAGIGNVYKSEACFACRVDPNELIHALDNDTIGALFVTASRMLRANLTTARRTTVDGGLAVYGRAGRRCRRCNTTIVSRRQGEHARVTYWCPSCQKPRGA
jgi:endonuclease-8